jgi:hypothetical protein
MNLDSDGSRSLHFPLLLERQDTNFLYEFQVIILVKLHTYWSYLENI